MKRLLALLLAMGIVFAAAPDLLRAQEKEAKQEKKDDDKKDEKKKDDKKADEKKADKADEKITDAQKDELKKLSGTFTVSLFERDGEKYPEDKLKKMKVVQKGGDYTFHEGDDVTKGKDTVFPDKSPKECDSLYLDGTSKGGIALAIAHELKIPVKLIGIGEGIEDLRPFDPEDFGHALFDGGADG